MVRALTATTSCSFVRIDLGDAGGRPLRVAPRVREAAAVHPELGDPGRISAAVLRCFWPKDIEAINQVVTTRVFVGDLPTDVAYQCLGHLTNLSSVIRHCGYFTLPCARSAVFLALSVVAIARSSLSKCENTVLMTSGWS